MGVGTRLGVARERHEVVARIEQLAVEVVAGVAVDSVAAALANDVFLSTGHAPILRTEGVQDNRDVRNLVRTEQVVAGTGVVQVVVRVHHVGAVQRELHGGAGDAVGVHVAAAAFDVDADARNGHRECRQIAARHGKVFNQLGGERAREVGVLGLKHCSRSRHLDGFLGAFHGQDEVEVDRLAYRNRRFRRGRLQAGRDGHDAVIAGTQQGKAVVTLAAAGCRACFTCLGALEFNFGVGYNRAACVRDFAAQITGGHRLGRSRKGRRQQHQYRGARSCCSIHACPSSLKWKSLHWESARNRCAQLCGLGTLNLSTLARMPGISLH